MRRPFDRIRPSQTKRREVLLEKAKGVITIDDNKQNIFSVYHCYVMTGNIVLYLGTNGHE